MIGRIHSTHVGPDSGLLFIDFFEAFALLYQQGVQIHDGLLEFSNFTEGLADVFRDLTGSAVILQRADIGGQNAYGLPARLLFNNRLGAVISRSKMVF